jgi:hypothetical protein
VTGSNASPARPVAPIHSKRLYYDPSAGRSRRHKRRSIRRWD